MSYNEQSNGDPHGECAAEIARLSKRTAQAERLLAETERAYSDYVLLANHDKPGAGAWIGRVRAFIAAAPSERPSCHTEARHAAGTCTCKLRHEPITAAQSKPNIPGPPHRPSCDINNGGVCNEPEPEAPQDGDSIDPTEWPKVMAPARERDESRAPCHFCGEAVGLDHDYACARSTEALPGERPGPAGSCSGVQRAGHQPASVVHPPERARREVWVCESPESAPRLVALSERTIMTCALMSDLARGHRAVRYVPAEEVTEPHCTFPFICKFQASDDEVRAEILTLRAEARADGLMIDDLRAENARLAVERDAARAEALEAQRHIALLRLGMAGEAFARVDELRAENASLAAERDEWQREFTEARNDARDLRISRDAAKAEVDQAVHLMGLAHQKNNELQAEVERLRLHAVTADSALVQANAETLELLVRRVDVKELRAKCERYEEALREAAKVAQAFRASEAADSALPGEIAQAIAALAGGEGGVDG